MMKICLHVWLVVLTRNRGLSYKFILGRLPRARVELFVDAALTGGIGGYIGYYYFSADTETLKPLFVQCDG